MEFHQDLERIPCGHEFIKFISVVLNVCRQASSERTAI